MNLRTSAGLVTCAKCSKEVDMGFKIQGQSAHVCIACLGDHAMHQGVEKTLTIDGIHKGNYAEGSALGPSAEDEK